MLDIKIPDPRTSPSLVRLNSFDGRQAPCFHSVSVSLSVLPVRFHQSSIKPYEDGHQAVTNQSEKEESTAPKLAVNDTWSARPAVASVSCMQCVNHLTAQHPRLSLDASSSLLQACSRRMAQTLITALLVKKACQAGDLSELRL